MLKFINISGVSNNPSVLALLRFLHKSQLGCPGDPRHSLTSMTQTREGSQGSQSRPHGCTAGQEVVSSE